ncbi:glycosyltransferase family 4 protein [Halorientalis marina]|uniref:glycosyltransferase family 4 protein n=1 Tax=Halorientalis marina TaxID=2931976 RepID=UPI001FF2F819|nr:glycosyltransferase family 1 protein [Halorientalis marina]
MTAETITVGLDARFVDHPGIGRYVSKLLESLPERIHVLAVCLSDDRGDVVDLRPTADVAVTDAKPFGIREQIALPRLLGRHDIDCFHATQFTIPVAWRGPLVTTIHDCAYDRFPAEFGDRGRIARYYLRTMMRLAVARSDRIITPSESTKRDVQRFYGGDDSLFEVIYHGVDAERFNPEAPSPTIVDGEYLLHVGSNRPRKNINGLLDGYARAVSQLDAPPKLVMVGDHEDRFVDLTSAIAHRGLTDLVISPGYVDDAELVKLYANALAFIFPSHYEGFGLPVLEAMASGTPIIAADAASLPEMCGEAARYVDSSSSEDIGTGIVGVVTDDSFRKRLRKKGRARVLGFNWERTGRMTAAVYESVRTDVSPDRAACQ